VYVARRRETSILGSDSLIPLTILKNGGSMFKNACMFKNAYYIKSISKKSANRVITTYHYLHRAAACSFAYGLFLQGKIVGVVMYAPPASPSVCKGVCGDDEAHNVIELVRLWVSDNVPKNGESYLIANTLKLIPHEIIISYADPAYTHVGTVYQATNWIYTGLSSKGKDVQIGDRNLHTEGLTNKYTMEDMKIRFGDSFRYKERNQKHRYIYFNCNRRRKRELLTKLKFPVFPYPKFEGQKEFHVNVLQESIL
jgi:hypothetical protein